jgi:hypothetical protein
MKLRNILAFALFTAATAFAQQTQSNSGGNNVQQQQVQSAPVEKSALEQKGYDEAKREIQLKNEQDAADKKKAADAAAKQAQRSIVTYSALERAQQEMLSASTRKKVNEAKKLLQKAQKLQAELAAVNEQLKALNQQVVAVEKIAPEER